MGCDGGTIPRRDELVRVQKKPEQVDKNAENAAKWKHCAISQQPLQKPIVACELGKLYNKDAVIEHLLSKESPAEVASHVKSLSDVKELKLTENNGFKEKAADRGDEYVDVNASRYICPVSGAEMNGKVKFCFLWKCGCVLSEKSVREIKSDVCHSCGQSYEEDDVIILNGSDEEAAVLKEKMEVRRQKAKLEKKRKKAAKSSSAAASSSQLENNEKKIKLEEPSSSKVNGKIEKLEVPTEKSAASTSKLVNGSKASVSKLGKNYSIAKDPNASSAFKSLFTSHEKAKNQQKAHWITHNPLYF